MNGPFQEIKDGISGNMGEEGTCIYVCLNACVYLFQRLKNRKAEETESQRIGTENILQVRINFYLTIFNILACTLIFF